MISWLERTLAITPSFAPAWERIGEMAAEQRDWAAATRAWNRALEVNPFHTPARTRLALRDLEQNEPERALARLESNLVRHSAQWQDRRPIKLKLDPDKVLLCTKPGHTSWPSKNWKKDDPDQLYAHTITTADSLWLRTTRMSRWAKVLCMLRG